MAASAAAPLATSGVSQQQQQQQQQSSSSVGDSSSSSQEAGISYFNRAPTFTRSSTKRSKMWNRVLKAKGTVRHEALPTWLGINYAVSQVPSAKDEDAFGVWTMRRSSSHDENVYHASCDDDDLRTLGVTAAFGVFDGHGGRNTSKMCANELVRMIAEELCKLKQTPSIDEAEEEEVSECVLDELTEEQKEQQQQGQSSGCWDPLLDLAIVRAMQHADRKAKSKWSDGSTAVLVLLRPDDDGDTLMKVAWVGDSRATIEIVRSSRSDSALMPDDDNNNDTTNVSRPGLSSSSSSPSSSLVVSFRHPEGVYALSEDHKPDSVEEMERINNNSKQDSLSTMFKKFELVPENPFDSQSRMVRKRCKTMARELGSDQRTKREWKRFLSPWSDAAGAVQYYHGTRDGRSSPDGLEASFGSNSSMNSMFSNSSSSASSTPKLVSQRSYVGHLVNQTGHAVGPLRVIKIIPGASGTMSDAVALGVAMSRSIGDRDGPRSCISTPDIVDARINKYDAARIIVASDGVWDVFNQEGVHAVASLAFASQRAANDLVIAARAGRHFHHLHADDITAIVLDVNMTDRVHSDHATIRQMKLEQENRKKKQEGGDHHEGSRGATTTAAASRKQQQQGGNSFFGAAGGCGGCAVM